MDIEGIDKVSEAIVYYPDMSTSKDYTQIASVWEEYGYNGEGMVVSIIDTGIDYTHKDMVLTDPSSAKLKEEDINIEFGKYFTEKVPYGYNFADKDDLVIDTSGSMHGMHVAGIVGSNASDEDINNDNGIKGVAPESQLLAMKVFSNNSEVRGAYSDDIIAAIETSVQLGADVINMSLGAVAGFRDENSPEQVAIKNATDDGVLCVVSAGNSTTATNPFIVEGISDTSTVGSPGIAKDALQVASSENSFTKLSAFTAIISGSEYLMGYTETDLSPLDVFSQEEELELVNAGFGRAGDYEGLNLEGKIALVQRGEIGFIEKQLNAQNAGAVAIVVYNNTNDEGYVNMATDPSVKIPAVFITRKDGLLLKDNIDNSKVKFNNKVVSLVNTAANEMSDFTSWGPTPDLQFAPQITGPGGNIYSTINGNRYGSMSGTSMSSPHVAGATTLIMQAVKEKGLNLEGRDLVEYVKKTVINTAEPLIEDTVFGETLPYSPRRQGSGMIQAKAAIENSVLALGENNEAVIALKEINERTEFSIKLKNYSNEKKSFRVESYYDVLTAFEPSMIEEYYIYGYVPFDTQLEGGSLTFDKNEVEVPANGEVTINANLTLPEGAVTNNFVEGFIKVISSDGKNPDLVVPYMGYYGDWEEEAIMDDLPWNEDNIVLSPSFPVGEILGEYYYLGYTEGEIVGDNVAISPNNDEFFDNLLPTLFLLRNAKEIKVDLLDGNKNVMAENIVTGNDLRRNILEESGGQANLFESLAWDGTKYNSETGVNEVLEEGQYYLNYKARIDGGENYQELTIPVKIDLTPIKTTLESASETKDTEYDLNITFGGELLNSKIASLLVIVNGEELEDYILEEDSLKAEINLIDNKVNTIEVYTLDNAGNTGKDTFNIGVGDYEPEIRFDNFEEGMTYTDNKLALSGSYLGDIEKILINGQDVKNIGDGKFSTTIELNEGYNNIEIKAFNSKGDEVFNNTYKVFCDTLSPEIELHGLNLSEDGVLVTAKDSIVLKGSISDNTLGYKFYVNEELKLDIHLDESKGAEDTYREFEYEIPVVDGDTISLRAVDSLGNETNKEIKVVVDKTLPEVELEGVANGKVYNTNIKPNILNSDKLLSVEALLNGEAYNFEEISEEGEYELVLKVVGLNELERTITIKFTIDKTNPTITFTNLIDGSYYNSNISPIIEINEKVQTLMELNGKYYNGEAITEEGKYSLYVKATDLAGNVAESTINFVIDKTAPVLEVKDVIDGMKYDKEVLPNIKSEEGAVVEVTLNGEAYDGELINQEGEYELKVIAKDKAGNITEVIRKFTIKFPIAENEKGNPTPKPVPGNPPGEADKTNDDNIEKNDKENNSKLPINKEIKEGNTGGLPTTGGTNTNLLLISALVILLAGVSIIRYKKVNKKEETK